MCVYIFTDIYIYIHIYVWSNLFKYTHCFIRVSDSNRNDMETTLANQTDEFENLIMNQQCNEEIIERQKMEIGQ